MTTPDPAAPVRTRNPPRAHDWADYMDGDCRCRACGMRRRTWELSANRPCLGAGKETVDVE